MKIAAAVVVRERGSCSCSSIQKFQRFVPPVCVFPKIPARIVFGYCCCCCSCCCWAFGFDPNRSPQVGLLVVLPNRLVVPVFVEVFPVPPNNGVELFYVCCVTFSNKLPVVFIFGCVLSKIEVLPLGLACWHWLGSTENRRRTSGVCITGIAEK